MSWAKQQIKCSEKVKLKKRDAERKAFWRGMRCYKCPVCHWFHLTCQGGALYRGKVSLQGK